MNTTIVIVPASWALLHVTAGRETPVEGWQKFRRIVAEYVIDNYPRPYPARIVLDGEQARALRDFIVDAGLA